MTKHHWRQQIKSLFEIHADPDKHQQLKQSRIEMEEKKEKIIKLIKSEQQDGSKGKTESLEELVEDYHKQYESLYDDYHHLTEEMNKNVYSDNGEKGKSSTSSSDSDSNKDSSSKGSKYGKSRKEIERVTSDLQLKLEATNHEIDALTKKLATAQDEKEAVRLESTKTLNKLRDAEKTIEDLKAEATRWNLDTAGLKQRIMEAEESALKFESEKAELRSKVVDLELNLRSAERKTDDLSRGNQSHDQLVIELQTTIEDLKRDIEMDKDEMTTIEEKNRNLEVMLRLSNQKLRVTEQLLNEKETSHKRLEDRNAALSQTIGEYSLMIGNISEQLNTSVGQLERVITEKFNEGYGGLAKRVVALSKEVGSVKRSIKNRLSEINDVEIMRKTIEKLEEEAREAKAEKEERVLSIGEEKREAIRQLCLWTEYYRGRYQQLLKMNT